MREVDVWGDLWSGREEAREKIEVGNRNGQVAVSSCNIYKLK